MTTELANTGNSQIATLDSLAMQARMFAQGIALNVLQLGRVLTEAKKLVHHGEWDKWILENAGMSRRKAEQYMQAFCTFGLNKQIAELGITKITKMLPMLEEDRSRLLEEHNVAAMTTRELDEAIKKQRQQLVKEAHEAAQDEINKERNARIAAEQRAAEAENRIPEVPKEIKEELDTARSKVKEQQERIEQLEKAGSDRYQQVLSENERLKQEITERDEMLEEQQADYNRIQTELLNAKSSIAKGDAERIPLDQLTPEAFASAVRSFIGACARMPYMTAAFSCMSHEEKNEYDELLRTIEGWASDSRKALDSVVIDGEATVDEWK